LAALGEEPVAALASAAPPAASVALAPRVNRTGLIRIVTRFL
jgi:hypothetical protein